MSLNEREKQHNTKDTKVKQNEKKNKETFTNISEKEEKLKAREEELKKREMDVEKYKVKNDEDNKAFELKMTEREMNLVNRDKDKQ